jgi:hypothetical protein
MRHWPIFRDLGDTLDAAPLVSRMPAPTQQPRPMPASAQQAVQSLLVFYHL